MKWRIVLACALVASRIARADELVCPTSHGELAVALHDAGALPRHELALEIDGEARIAPSERVSWSFAGPPIALTLLVQDTTELVVDDQVRRRQARDARGGARAWVRETLEAVQLERSVPHGSELALATYGRALTLRGSLRAEHLPDEDARDAGTELSASIAQAAARLDALLPVPSQKVIIVLGDGCDSVTSPHRVALAAYLAARQIELHTVSVPAGACADVTPELTRHHHRVALANLPDALLHVVEHLDDRTYFVFDRAQLPDDGEAHHYRLVGTRSLPSTPCALPSSGASSLLVGLGLGALGALLLGLLGRRPRVAAGVAFAGVLGMAGTTRADADLEPDFAMTSSANDDALVEIPRSELALQEIALEIEGRLVASWRIAHAIYTQPTVEGIVTAIRNILASLDDRMYAWFDRDQLPWDGELHEYYVHAGGLRLGPVFRELPDRRTVNTWWRYVVGVGALALLFLGFLVAIRRWHRSTTAILR